MALDLFNVFEMIYIRKFFVVVLSSKTFLRLVFVKVFIKLMANKLRC